MGLHLGHGCLSGAWPTGDGTLRRSRGVGGPASAGRRPASLASAVVGDGRRRSSVELVGLGDLVDRSVSAIGLRSRRSAVGLVGSVIVGSVDSVLAVGSASASAPLLRRAAWAFLSGPRTMVMLRPSSFGIDLDPADVRPRASATWSRIASPELGVLHLPAPEHDRDLDLVALAEELLDLAGLGVEVAGADLGPVLHLLDRRRWCSCLPGFLGPLGRLVLVLAVVHDPADRRVGLVGHLDEVEVELPGHGQRLGQGLDADLVAVGADQAHLAGSDAIVDPGLVVGGVLWPFTPHQCAALSLARWSWA